MLWANKPKDAQTLIHEIVHCVTDLMEGLSIKDDEFRAWYTDWLFKKISSLIKQSK